MPTVIKSIFGSIALLKGFCKTCKKQSIILEGRFSCCDSLVQEQYDKERLKRESEGERQRSDIPLKIKKEVLEEQQNQCIYCDKNFNEHIWNDKKEKYIKLRIHYDHFVCWTFSRDNNKYNIVASCHICNILKGDKHFRDLISVKEYLNAKRKEKGYNW